MFVNKFFNFNKEYENLTTAGITGGYWIDAGCGRGAYTIPLSKLVDKVLALDLNTANLLQLQKKIEQEQIANIRLKQGDLRDRDEYKDKKLQGVLFAFSIHYQTNIEFLKELLKEKESQKGFKLVIIEYTRTTPVYWVPHPYPVEKILSKLSNIQQKAEIKFKNNRYYILVLE